MNQKEIKKAKREELQQFLHRGPVSLIAEAERSLSLVNSCAESIGAPGAKSFEELFGAIQSIAINHFVLSVVKVFDAPSKRYPNYSLPSLLEWIKMNSEFLEVHPIVNNPEDFTAVGVSEELFQDDHETCLTCQIVAQMQEKIPQVDKSQALDALKTLRDKQIAHPERIPEPEKLEKTTWEEAEQLLEIAKQFVGAINCIYIPNWVYWDDSGGYALTGDATRPGRAMRRLIKRLAEIQTHSVQ